MVERALHKKEFLPIVQPGEFLELYPKKKNKFFKVEMVFPLGQLEVDFCDSDHLDADLTTTESAEKEIDDIYVDDGELLQFRMIPRDDFKITWIGKPKARTFLSTKNKTWWIPAQQDDARLNPANEELHLYEFFQSEDTEFWIKCQSYSATLTAARIVFIGYRFILTEVGVDEIPKGIKPTKVPVEGYPGSSE